MSFQYNKRLKYHSEKFNQHLRQNKCIYFGKNQRFSFTSLRFKYRLFANYMEHELTSGVKKASDFAELVFIAPRMTLSTPPHEYSLYGLNSIFLISTYSGSLLSSRRSFIILCKNVYNQPVIKWLLHVARQIPMSCLWNFFLYYYRMNITIDTQVFFFFYRKNRIYYYFHPVYRHTIRFHSVAEGIFNRICFFVFTCSAVGIEI